MCRPRPSTRRTSQPAASPPAERRPSRVPCSVASAGPWVAAQPEPCLLGGGVLRGSSQVSIVILAQIHYPPLSHRDRPSLPQYDRRQASTSTISAGVCLCVPYCAGSKHMCSAAASGLSLLQSVPRITAGLALTSGGGVLVYQVRIRPKRVITLAELINSTNALSRAQPACKGC